MMAGCMADAFTVTAARHGVSVLRIRQ